MQWSEFAFRVRDFSASDQEMIRQAFEMGEKAHTGQMRKSGEPYFTHPIAVAEILLSYGADKETVIAALLHDTLEDTDLTLKDIQAAFGTNIASMIDGLTKLMEEDVIERASLNKKIETLRKMFTVMQQDVRIMVIKLADRLHNMQTISHRAEHKQQQVAKETLDIYAKIADRLCMRDMRDQLEWICRSVLEAERHAELVALREDNGKRTETILSAMRRSLMAEHPSFRIDIEGEAKTWEKLLIQYELAKKSDRPQMLLNVVLLCETVDHCYQTLGLLHRLWPREAMTFDDFINTPVINGYKALHTTIILEDGTRIRCKIRTYDMENYAHIGVCTRCFDSSSKGVLSYLPWAKHISPLTQDTKDRSEEFWESLQSDILSESIIIYGPRNESTLIPKGATALDGALQLFRDDALKLLSIRVNGVDVDPSHILSHGMTLDITTGSAMTADRSWLYVAQTGVAAAMIRAALEKSDEQDLQEIGRSLMQQAFLEQGKGYFEEFNDRLVKKGLQRLGYATQEEAYIALANRHINTSDIMHSIFDDTKRASQHQFLHARQRCSFSFLISNDQELLTRLHMLLDRFNGILQDIRFHPVPEQKRIEATLRASLSPDEQEELRSALLSIGATDMTTVVSVRTELALMSIVILFWALNPVIATSLLTAGIDVPSLVMLRSFFFCLYAVIFYIAWRFIRGSLFVPIPRIARLALQPAAATFVLSLLTYASLEFLQPSVHLLILRFNAVLLPMLHLRKRVSERKHVLTVFLGFLLFSLLLLLLNTDIREIGILLSIFALSSYLFYSLSSERILQEFKIGLRYPQLLFYMGILFALFGLLLAPFAVTSLASLQAYLLPVALYVLFCVFVPHTAFQSVLQRVRFRHVTSISLFEVPLAMLLEATLLGITLLPLTYASIFVILLGFVWLLWKRFII